VPIGVVSLTTPWNGGAFQFESLMLTALGKLHEQGRHKIEFLLPLSAAGLGWLAGGELQLRGMPVRLLVAPADETIEPAGIVTASLLEGLRDPKRASALYAADWLFLTAPSELGFLSGRPFVMPIHDLQHRLQPEFPEVANPAEFKKREFLFGNACRYATLIVVDSETSKEDVLRCYGDGIEPDRIRVLPLFPVVAAARVDDPAMLAAVRARYHLPERFFFYPAQFWSHKNHVRIIDAIAQVAARTGTRMPIALCGLYNDPYRARAFEILMARKTELGLDDCVHYMGFVPDDDMPALYSQAVGLVMPTFFGPSNIPILEAWMCGCPTITSDIRGLREQSGDAAILVDPRSVDAIADAMWRLWSDPACGAELARRGTARARYFATTDYAALIGQIVDDASARVAAGRIPAPLQP
jgi:glycosyltransferase involved in cell wall biosynthesis